MLLPAFCIGSNSSHHKSVAVKIISLLSTLPYSTHTPTHTQPQSLQQSDKMLCGSCINKDLKTFRPSLTCPIFVRPSAH